MKETKTWSADYLGDFLERPSPEEIQRMRDESYERMRSLLNRLYTEHGREPTTGY